MTQPPGSKERRHQVRLIIAIVIAAIVVTVIALATILITRTTSYTDSGYSSGGGSTPFNETNSLPLCPAGAAVSGSFVAFGFTDVHFSVVAPNGTTIWRQATSPALATFSLPTCGTYQFTVAAQGGGTVDVSVTLQYTAPLL